MDIAEALYTTRAMRRVKPDPIPLEVQARILDAAIRAPSGGNTQNWRFLLVDDPAVIGLIETWRPDVVIFDNAGRTAQLRAARRCGARVVYISARPRQRRKAFRLRWMRLIDEHWIANPEFLAGALGVLERLKLALLQRPTVRYLDVMLTAARGICKAAAGVAQGGWDRVIGTEVWRKTLAIVGLGHIGKAVAQRARGFAMRVLAVSRGSARENETRCLSHQHLARRTRR